MTNKIQKSKELDWVTEFDAIDGAGYRNPTLLEGFAVKSKDMSHRQIC